MPLIQGASASTCKRNFRILIDEGYNIKRAFAIMASICRKNMIKVTLERRTEITNRNYFGNYYYGR